MSTVVKLISEESNTVAGFATAVREESYDFSLWDYNIDCGCENCLKDALLSHNGDFPNYPTDDEGNCSCGLCTAFLEYCKPLIETQLKSKPTSQKASGIVAIRKYFKNGSVGGVLSVLNLRKILFYPHGSTKETIRDNLPLFVRPCPQTPEHGFVDSRVVNTMPEFDAVVDETEATGQPLELICAPPINARWSAVLTPTSLTYGQGNDGATSGTSARNLSINSQKGDMGIQMFGFKAADAWRDSKIAPGDEPYYEIVKPEFDCDGATTGTYPNKSDKQKSLPQLVQMRGGPSVSKESNYVPKSMVVKNVVDATGDLVEWKKICEKMKPGTVAYGGPNGSMSSHYSVHCKLNDIPIINIGKRPNVGDKLRVTTNKTNYSTRDYINVARYIVRYLSTPITNISESILVSMSALHNYAAFNLRESHQRRLLAYGIASMARIAVALVAGEMRHWSHTGPGNSSGKQCPVRGLTTKRGISRESIYTKFAKKSAMYSAERLRPIIKGFETKGWSSSYGGKKWAECSRLSERFYFAIASFLINRDKATFKSMITAYNELVNAVHNGGKMFNKVIGESQMEQISNHPWVGLINNTVYNVLYDDTEARNYPKPTGDRLVKVIEQTPKLARKATKVDSTSVEYAQIKVAYIVETETIKVHIQCAEKNREDRRYGDDEGYTSYDASITQKSLDSVAIPYGIEEFYNKLSGMCDNASKKSLNVGSQSFDYAPVRKLHINQAHGYVTFTVTLSSETFDSGELWTVMSSLD